ncbi:sulfotransferase [Gramella sp. MT6]|uniref:sulfotransferase family protein n=1 Tax=Gramella sp. MT6 TaxID=2705471 RepID=UPI001C604729|nr:sulfotransferase [Gramella sp. MT6]QYA24031.1 sulfotransferase [Gramella sp. MT6]
MKIENAIIILGPGKSGTTLFNNILSLHRDLYWISSYLNKFPEKHYLALLNNLNHVKWIEKQIRNKNNFPKPSESFQFWTHYIPRFPSNLKEYDAAEIGNAIEAARNIGKYQKGNRLVIKFTGPSRIEFIEEIFEKPTIIWIDRDPRAIVASFFSSKWRYKNRMEVFRNKPRKEIIEEYANYYEWISKEKESLKQFPFLHVHYESLIEDPLDFFERICSFSNLEFYTDFKELIESWNIKKQTNDKFLRLFSTEEISHMNSIFDKAKS